MKRKSIVFVLVVLLAVGLTAPVALAKKGERVEINPFHPPPGACYEVRSDDQVVVTWGWLACSKGLVSDYLEAIDIHEYHLNGQLILGTEKANKQFGPIQETSEPVNDPYRCIWDAPHKAIVPWEYKLKGLQPGINELHTYLTVAYAIIDGGERCTDWPVSCDGPWELNVFGTPGWAQEASITIAVDTACPPPP